MVLNMFIDEVKAFLRVIDDHSDELIQTLIDTAEELVEGATGQEYEGTNLENMCVKLLVRHWYDTEEKDVPFGIQTLMTQIEYKS